MSGGESELDGECAVVDELAVFGAVHVGADDRVVGAADENLRRSGGLADAIVGVPAAGVGGADVEIDAGVAGLGFEQPTRVSSGMVM